jgi:hypothetical protein
MTEIDDEAGFDALLREPYAILLIYAEWTPSLEWITALLEGWEAASLHGHSPPGTRAFRVHPWGFAHAHDWIYRQPDLQFTTAEGHLTCLSASGTLVWLRAGKVVGVRRRVLQATAEELTRRTLEAFVER